MQSDLHTSSIGAERLPLPVKADGGVATGFGDAAFSPPVLKLGETTTALFDGRTLTQVHVPGALVLHQDTPQQSVGAFRFAIRSGVRDEDALHSGFHHAVEHLLVRAFREGMLREGITRGGGAVPIKIKASTGFDSIDISCSSGIEILPRLLQIFCEPFARPDTGITPELIRPELNRIQVEALESRASPGARLAADLSRRIYPDSYFSKCGLGDLAARGTVDEQALKHFFASQIMGSRLALSIVGAPLEFAHSCAAVLSHEVGSEKLEEPPRPSINERGPELFFRRRPGGLLSLAAGFPCFGSTDPRGADLTALSAIFCATLQARLLDREGLIYREVRAIHHEDELTGMVGFRLNTAPRHFEQVMKIVREELELHRAGVPHLELFQAKVGLLQAEATYAAELASAVCAQSLNYAVGNSPFSDFTQMLRRLEEVTPASVKAVAQTFFRPETMQLVVYGSKQPPFDGPVVVGGPVTG